MPTPVGHALAGYAVSRFSSELQRRDAALLVTLSVFAAIAPDLDFIPGAMTGQPGAFHSSFTHSIGFALVVSLFLAGFFSLRSKRFLPAFGLFLVSYLTHLVLDFLNYDGRFPYGVPLFWPLSPQYFISPITVFPGVRHAAGVAGSTLEFLESLVHIHNLWAIAVEILVVGPFVVLGERLRKRNARRMPVPDAEQCVERGNA